MAVFGAAILVLNLVGFQASIIFWGLGLLVLYLFRDPERVIPALPLAVVSPVDGEVIAVDAVEDPYLQRASTLITLRMNPSGVYITRSPTEGKVLQPPNMANNGQAPFGVWLQTDEGDDVVMVVGRGRLHSNPRCYIRFGERIGQGMRCGFVPLGGRVDVYVPQNSRVSVTAGDRVQGGSDVLATLVHT